VLSGRGQCDGPIAGPEKSYRVWWVITECDLERSTRKKHMSTRAVELLEGGYETFYVTDRKSNCLTYHNVNNILIL
jgi:hypothetical protein